MQRLSGALQSARNTMLAAGQVTCAHIIPVPRSFQHSWTGTIAPTCIIFADGAGLPAIVKQEDTNKRMLHFAGEYGRCRRC